MPQLAIFVRSGSEHCAVKEELLDIVPLKDRTCGSHRDSNDGCGESEIDSKLTTITTMLGAANGLIGLC